MMALPRPCGSTASPRPIRHRRATAPPQVAPFPALSGNGAHQTPPTPSPPPQPATVLRGAPQAAPFHPAPWQWRSTTPATPQPPLLPRPPWAQPATALTNPHRRLQPPRSGNGAQQHPPRKSKSKGPYICALCAKEFKNGYNLRRHEATHSGPKATRGPAPGAMKMPTMVPLSLLSVAGLGGAGTEGGGGGGGSGGGATPPSSSATPKRARKNHACEMCGKAFRDVYHLKRHKLSHSDEKPYQCPVCQQRFKRKDRMSYHVRSHDGAVHKPYGCSHCGKSFSRPDHLNSHVRQVHSTERPFKCETCEAAFATKDRLRAHTVRHEEKVPCHVCGKMLSAAYIGDHMKVHGQGPAHVCELCNKGFTTAAYLRVHAVKDHGAAAAPPRRLLCRLCGVHCKTPAQLRGHLQTHGAAPHAAAATAPHAAAGGPEAQGAPPLR